ALPHRHTHRGPWDSGPLPTGLVAGLQHDALAEGAQLALIDRALAFSKLADLARAAGHRQDRDPVARDEMRRWSHSADDPARDGVPAQAFPASSEHQPGRLPQRDFDLGRGLGLLPGRAPGAAPGGAPPAPPPRGPAPRGRRRARWAARGAGPARVVATGRQPMGVRQPASPATGSRADPRPDPRPPGPARLSANTPATRPGPYHPLHRPPAAR